MNNVETKVQFLDAHGNVWVSCSPEHPEAEAFGPHGTARPLGAHVGPLRSQFHLDGDWWIREVKNQLRFQRSKDLRESEEAAKQFATSLLEEADEFRALGDQECFFGKCTTTGLTAAGALEHKAQVMGANSRWYAKRAKQWEEIEAVEEALHDATWSLPSNPNA